MSRNETISRLRNQIAALESSQVSSFEQAGRNSGSPFSCWQFEDVQPIDLEGVKASDDEDTADQPGGKEKQKPGAFDRIVRWTSNRFRSEADLRKRLLREGYTLEQIDEAIERAQRCLLIDDERFADVLVRSRVRAGKGKVGIESELRKEGIDPFSLPGWPEDYFSDDDESELDRAVSFLDKHPTRSKNPRQAAYRKLLGKGYSSSIAGAASRIWCERL